MSEIIITDAVYDRLALILETEGDESIEGLRIYVKGGGCSGFQYGFEFVQEIAEDDTVFENKNNLKIVIDPMSIMYLDGATIDYVKNLQGEHFSINNPNVKTTCGCGSSFST
jgi:iron-sulfur cluster insertion protein